MTFVEVVIGVGIALAVITGAVLFALWPRRGFGPRRHDVRGNGDHTDGHLRSRDDSFGGDAGGGDGGD
ncbi:MAG: hypothetical protein AAF214_01675 [Pseudomonadota bacterium]